jgi:hypothetical protein
VRGYRSQSIEEIDQILGLLLIGRRHHLKSCVESATGQPVAGAEVKSRVLLTDDRAVKTAVSKSMIS